MMIKFKTAIQKFDAQGEKTGWSYLLIKAEQAEQIKAGCKKSYRVKGQLDEFAIAQIAILPMGGGDFIMPLNAAMRKSLGKRQGAIVRLSICEDKAAFVLNADFLTCLDDEPAAKQFFETLTPGHRRYFSKWIDSAKTTATQAKRIAIAVNALAKKMDYGQMIRSQRQV
jgi:hypothetical protein